MIDDDAHLRAKEGDFMDEKQRPAKDTLKAILQKLGLPGIGDEAIQAFTSDEDGCEYAVWKIDTGEKPVVLKRAKGMELEAYRCFFREKKPYVPAFLGACPFGGDTYFLTEYCSGRDLRICDRAGLIKALDALVEMQDEFWQREALYGSCMTLDKALEGIENRGRYLGSERLETAYEAFVRVFKETPRTLCHDDLLPINLLVNEERAVLIDWEYGGVLPYAGSFARLIAHGREDKDAYFYLSQEDRAFAIEYYYEKLLKAHGIPYAEYRRTLDHFLFYEYCEWIMLGNRYDNRSDARYGYYLNAAQQLAERLIPQQEDG